MRLPFRAILLAAAATLATALFASTGSVRAEAGETSRRFQGTAQGAVTEFTTPADWVIDYEGNATHLGKFTRRELISFTGPGTFGGTIVFVAANGDKLNADFEGHFVSPNDAVGTYTFTGGSGRFSDATGAATFTAHTPDGLHVSVEFDGTIDY